VDAVFSIAQIHRARAWSRQRGDRVRRYNRARRLPQVRAAGIGPFRQAAFFGPTVANGALRTLLDLQLAPPSRYVCEREERKWRGLAAKSLSDPGCVKTRFM
jgi:hypothetical protein